MGSLIVAQAATLFGYAMVNLFAASSFLGLGVQAPAADWGYLVNGKSVGHFAELPVSHPHQWSAHRDRCRGRQRAGRTAASAQHTQEPSMTAPLLEVSNLTVQLQQN